MDDELRERVRGGDFRAAPFLVRAGRDTEALDLLEATVEDPAARQLLMEIVRKRLPTDQLTFLGRLHRLASRVEEAAELFRVWTAEARWWTGHGGAYGLELVLEDSSEASLRAATEALLSHPTLDCCYADTRVEPLHQRRLSARDVVDGPSGEVRGFALLPTKAVVTWAFRAAAGKTT
jgi:hypothetical protein